MADAPRPIRRPTLPPVPPSMETRVSLLEREDDQHREDILGLEGSLRGLAEKIGTLTNSVDALAVQVKTFSESRTWWLKVLSSVVGAGAFALIGWLIRISWFVQSSRLPNP